MTEEKGLRVHSYLGPEEYLELTTARIKTEKGEPLINIYLHVQAQDCMLNHLMLTKKEATILRNRLESFIVE